MLNVVNLMGRLGQDPELKYTQAGKAVAYFSIAVSRDYEKDGQRETDWINIVCFGKTAEFAANYFRKGQMCAISGSILTSKFTTNDGKQRTSFNIKADSIYFCESKKTEDKPAAKTTDAFDDMNFDDINLDDIPF